jgi:signal transduction histidine kinase
VNFNVEHVVKHSQRIDAIWRASALVGLLLGGVSLLLTTVATALAARTVRRKMRFERQRGEELEMFAGRVAHDLLSPLGATTLALQLIEHRSGEPKSIEMAARARTAVGRVRLIVDALLGFARAGAQGEPGAHASADAVVADVLGEMMPQAQASSIRLHAEPFPPCEVACAPGILTVLLSNLVRNSLKFMGERALRVVAIRVSPDEQRVRFEVEDTGPGLPAGFAHSAFEPYVRGPSAERPGIGLGLATVKRLVEAHGGRVGVETSRPTGALFWFELPRAPAPRDTDVEPLVEGAPDYQA